MFDSPTDQFHPRVVRDKEAAGTPDGKSPSKVLWLDIDLLYYNIERSSSGNLHATMGRIQTMRELENWLSRWQEQSSHAAGGRLRLLVCERKHYNPVSFSMIEQAFNKVVNHFGLPNTTLHTLCNNGGLSAKHFVLGSQKQISAIQILVKAWQNDAIGNFGLALSHDIETQTTSALLHGTGVADQSQFDPLRDLIHTSAHGSFAHPLLLPSILLWRHVRCMQPVVVKYEDRVINAEGQLGVVRTGRHKKIIHIREKQNFRDLTKEIYTVLTDILFTTHCCGWQRRFESFLSDELNPDSLTSVSSLLSQELQHQSRWIRQGVHNLADESESLASFLAQLRARIEKQPEVMYNRVNANMAVTGLKDNATMKTLAVIAAVFLPGTYIATVFSMSMFDWQIQNNGANDNGTMMSNHFWIYWAVTLPLTLVVLTTGWLWWRSSRKRSAEAVMDDVRDLEKGVPKQKSHQRRRGDEITSLRKITDDVQQGMHPAELESDESWTLSRGEGSNEAERNRQMERSPKKEEKARPPNRTIDTDDLDSRRQTRREVHSRDYSVVDM